ncbi:hypothetical protein OG361_12285 [Streptomyces sp. NBC_00090]|uniref:hypothetical protein n=1 Tax=Streptomyces sp. NBC_00090 TaxID=2903619 RepID=UPI0032531AE9
MQGRRWAAVVAGAGAAAVTLFGAGAGGAGGSGSGFGREAARAEIVAAVAAAGLPESELPGLGAPEPTDSASPRPTPSTERERLELRVAACAAAWQYMGPVVDGARGKFDATVATLAREGWAAGKRHEEKLDDKGSTTAAVTLKRNGWTLMARHTAGRAAMTMDAVTFHATEDACMRQFGEREMELLFGDGEQG